MSTTSLSAPGATAPLSANSTNQRHRPPPGPYPQTAQLGLTLPCPDIPISATLLLCFLAFAIYNIMRFQHTRRVKYPFPLMVFVIAFPFVRAISLVLRVTVAFGVGILSAVVVLGLVVGATVQSFFVKDQATRDWDHRVQLGCTVYLALYALLPAVLMAVAYVVPGKQAVDKFGDGTMSGKAWMLGLVSVVLGIGAVFRAAVAFHPRPLAQPAWYHSKVCFYCFNYVLELAALTIYAISKFEKRFFIPKGCKGPGDYSQGNTLVASNGDSGESVEEKSDEERGSHHTPAPHQSSRSWSTRSLGMTMTPSHAPPGVWGSKAKNSEELESAEKPKAKDAGTQTAPVELYISSSDESSVGQEELRDGLAKKETGPVELFIDEDGFRKNGLLTRPSQDGGSTNSRRRNSDNKRRSSRQELIEKDETLALKSYKEIAETKVGEGLLSQSRFGKRGLGRKPVAKETGNEVVKEVVKEVDKEVGKEVAKEVGRETSEKFGEKVDKEEAGEKGKEVAKEVGQEVESEVGKEAVKETDNECAETATTAGDTHSSRPADQYRPMSTQDLQIIATMLAYLLRQTYHSGRGEAEKVD
ncbi:hypothetical protein N0V88_002853 [Collariella sp. IMI 366227]|nr:hypothetical protein N0V88_002853 [Collariella sp. IMI 366227]